jgi:tetratricopeptide (TPR) repeat protein/predicted Zn-ribbon and HTH transcriptional regulator
VTERENQDPNDRLPEAAAKADEDDPPTKPDAPKAKTKKKKRSPSSRRAAQPEPDSDAELVTRAQDTVRKNKEKEKEKDKPAKSESTAGKELFLCVHCGNRWHADAADPPSRCPSCMRKTGIEIVKREAGAGGKRTWIYVGVAVVVFGALAGGYAIWSGETADTVGDEVPMRPLELSELRGHVRRLHADVPDDAMRFFETDEAIEEFAEEATGDGSARARATKVVAALAARRRAQAYELWSMSSPRDSQIGDVRATNQTLKRDGGHAHLYPLEVAALAAVALRTEGVDAMIADIYDWEGARTPPDPSGHLGYYGLAIYDGEPGEGTPHVLDPYGGAEIEVEADDYRVLTDVEVLGEVMNHRAVHRMVAEGNHAQAFELSEAALKLDPRSPSVRSARAVVLVLTGGIQDGLAQFETAAQMRPDAVRRNNLAGVKLQMQDVEAASHDVSAALEQHPDFAGAHATLAAIHLMKNESADARRELDRAEELDSQLPNLPLLWAHYYSTEQDVDQAVSHVEEALRRRPHDAQTALAAAQIYRLAGRYDDMRRQARRVLELVPESQRPQFEQMIPRVLGPTALEDPDEELPIEDEEMEEEELGETGEDSLDFMLGESEDTALGSDLLPEGGTDTGMSSLRLGEDLQLNLDGE